MIIGFLYVVTKTNHMCVVRCSYKLYVVFVRLYPKPECVDKFIENQERDMLRNPVQ